MDMDIEKETYKNLWEDFLDLTEKYREDLPTHEMALIISQFVSKMAFDLASCPGEAYKTLLTGIELGRNWSHRESEAEIKTEGDE